MLDRGSCGVMFRASDLLRPALLAWVAACWLASCGGSEMAADNVNLRLVSVSAKITYADANPDPENNVVAARVSVSGPDMSDVSSEFDFSLDAFQIPEYMLGMRRQFSAEFLGPADPLKNDERPVVSRGRSVPIDVTERQTRIRSQIFVSPVNSFSSVVGMDDISGEPVISYPNNGDRVGASMTELDDGRILICGGAKVRGPAVTWYMPDDLFTLTSSCETYDPETGIFEEVPNRMTVKRAYHQAVKLGSPDNPDGRVVLIGGYTVPDGGAITVSHLVDIYDPRTGLFTSATSNEGQPGLYRGQGRALFTADLVNADKNLIVLFGGYSNVSAVGGTYDIIWVTGGSVMTIAHGQLYNKDDPAKGIVRYNHALARVWRYGSELTGGKEYEAYLVVGGENESGAIDTVEPYIITCAGVESCKLQRQDQLVVKIPGGGRSMPAVAYDVAHNFLFIVGGFGATGGKNPTDSVDVFRVPEAGFREREYLSLGIDLGGMSIAEMDDGRFLLAGGWNGTAPVDTVKILSPDGPVMFNGLEVVSPDVKSDVPAMDAARVGHSMITDQTGRVLIFGGVDNGRDSHAPLMYNPR